MCVLHCVVCIDEYLISVLHTLLFGLACFIPWNFFSFLQRKFIIMDSLQLVSWLTGASGFCLDLKNVEGLLKLLFGRPVLSSPQIRKETLALSPSADTAAFKNHGYCHCFTQVYSWPSEMSPKNFGWYAFHVQLAQHRLVGTTQIRLTWYQNFGQNLPFLAVVKLTFRKQWKGFCIIMFKPC